MPVADPNCKHSYRHVHTFFTPYRLKKLRCFECLKEKFVVEETGQEIPEPIKYSGTWFQEKE